jgi:Domain of unknown function (DUF6748)
VASRACLVAILLALAGMAAASTPARTPPIGTAMFLVQHDPRLCPSPLCGGYWVTIANGVRTRCGSGERQPRCYVAFAVGRTGQHFGDLPEGALVRGAIELGPKLGTRTLDRLRVWALYWPTGTATATGGYYRVVDNGIRCIRAPCFSYRAGQVNGSSSVTASSVDFSASGANPAEIARAEAALRTKDGLYARGRFATTADGGRAFLALRLYLRAPLPRA